MRNPRLVNGKMIDLTDEAADYYDSWLTMQDHDDVEHSAKSCAASLTVYAVVAMLVCAAVWLAW